jgi:RHS repeat-associated protein
VLQVSYDPGTGHLASLGSPGGEIITYSYDGFLPIGTTWSGPVTGAVSHSYDNNFRVVSTSVNGSDPVTFQYDQDDLLIKAGSLTLQRSSANGLLAGTTLGGITTAQSYNGFGELSELQASFGSAPLYQVTYTHDQLGRIAEKVETIGNVTEIHGYHYDSAGRLSDVVKDGSTLAHYDYDESGNRTSETNSSVSVVSIYDAQDRLLQHGDVTYTYSANGELATKTQNGATVTYSYDELRNLRRVALSDGTLIGYLIDGKNRRIGKQINGVLVKGFLYKDQLNPIAEMDGNGQVIARFVYGSRPHVPDYMTKGGVTYRIVSDQLGSPRLVVSSETGEILQRIDYDAFGRIILDTNPGFQPFGFAGGLYDYQTGLVRFGLRDYDPEVGRWTGKDPILLAGKHFNLYAYCFDDPVNFVDSDGQFPLAAAVAAAAFGPPGEVIAGAILLGIGVAIVWDIYHNPAPPPLFDPIQHMRPWNKPVGPGRACPPPTAIPGARPRTTPPPPAVDVDPAKDPKPTPDVLWDNEEQKTRWDKVVDGIAEWLTWLG